MKIRLYSRYRIDPITKVQKLVAGLIAETRSRIFDYNGIEGLQVFGKGELTDGDKAIARAMEMLYNNNKAAFDRVNSAFDDQIAREANGKLYAIFNDGVDIE